MATPIEPEQDERTGRLLTEWFEHPEYTDEDLFKIACENEGIDPKDYPVGWIPSLPVDEQELARRISNFVASRKRRKFSAYMSNQEVGHRLNEASKMTDPENFKFLPDDVRERTGLEVNPLWLMECMVRGGVLSAGETIGALKELAKYTHSQAASIRHNTNTEMKPEDWLLELAKAEYKTIDEVKPEVVQPKQIREQGSGKDYDYTTRRKSEAVANVTSRSLEELAELETMFGDDWMDEDDE